MKLSIISLALTFSFILTGCGHQQTKSKTLNVEYSAAMEDSIVGVDMSEFGYRNY